MQTSYVVWDRPPDGATVYDTHCRDRRAIALLGERWIAPRRSSVRVRLAPSRRVSASFPLSVVPLQTAKDPGPIPLSADIFARKRRAQTVSRHRVAERVEPAAPKVNGSLWNQEEAALARPRSS